MAKRKPAKSDQQRREMTAELLRRFSDADMERAVLGCLLDDDLRREGAPEYAPCYAAIFTFLRPEDFVLEMHRDVFEAAMALWRKGAAIDPVTVWGQLQEWAKTAALCDLPTAEKDCPSALGVPGLSYLCGLSSWVMTRGHALFYAEAVKRKAIERDYFGSMVDAQDEMIQGADTESIVGFIHDQSERLMTAHCAGKTVTAQTIQTAVDEIKARREAGESVTGVASGFPDLDEKTLGFQPGDLILLAARPSIGKSALAHNLCVKACPKGARVLVFSLEMSAAQWQQRILATVTGVAVNKLRTGHVNEFDLERLKNAANAIQTWAFEIDERPALAIQELMAAARKHRDLHRDLSLIVVDYLQLCKDPERVQFGETAVVTSISAHLKELARDLKIPVIALSQLNRTMERDENKTVPELKNLRQSGALEQDADLVLFLHRDKEREKQIGSEMARVLLRIGKHRNGALGDIELLYKGTETRFESMPRENYEPEYWGLKRRAK